MQQDITPKTDRPCYIIFAGINGAGKTSLYDVLDKNTVLGERISIDDIAKSLGDWRDSTVQIKAARTAMALIDSHISEKISFHQETTLPGDSVLKRVKRASEQGFYIELYYVGVDSLSIAIERVHKRVEMGGHGIDDRVIIKRFKEVVNNLRRIMWHCDKVLFYDNTLRFKQVAVFSGGKFDDIDTELPSWFKELLSESVPLPRHSDMVMDG